MSRPLGSPRPADACDPHTQAAPNDLQRSLVAGTARRLNTDATLVVGTLQTRQQAVDYFKRRPELARR